MSDKTPLDLLARTVYHALLRHFAEETGTEWPDLSQCRFSYGYDAEADKYFFDASCGELGASATLPKSMPVFAVTTETACTLTLSDENARYIFDVVRSHRHAHPASAHEL
jgi:hypothetical protein